MDSHLRNIPVYFFLKIDALVKEEKSIEDFSIFSSGAILFNGAERFEQVWKTVT